jgi:hypothetical protein
MQCPGADNIAARDASSSIQLFTSRLIIVLLKGGLKQHFWRIGDQARLSERDVAARVNDMKSMLACQMPRCINLYMTRQTPDSKQLSYITPAGRPKLHFKPKLTVAHKRSTTSHSRHNVAPQKSGQSCRQGSSSSE